jgi:hypothetical protein
MVIPRLQDQVSSLRDNMQDTRKFARIEAITLRNADLRLQPDFGIPTAPFDVNVRRLQIVPRPYLPLRNRDTPAISIERQERPNR